MAGMDTRDRAVVLLSGGIDSSTSLAIARSEGFELYALTFDYRQRHQAELDSARAVAAAIGVERHLFSAFDMGAIGGSALTSDIEVPKGGIGVQGSGAGKKNPKQAQIPVTYVPARNTIFLSFALAWAEVLGAGNIFIGANAIDYSGYPDCRPEYLEAFQNMANLATRASVEGRVRFAIRAPLISMTKPEIIRRGVGLGLDYGLTWSCYDPQKNNTDRGFKPCGLCDSCVIRAKGFREAGLKDPLLGG